MCRGRRAKVAPPVGVTVLSLAMLLEPQEPCVTLSRGIAPFLEKLRRRDVAPETVQTYSADPVRLTYCFLDATGEPLSARALNSTDVVDDKADLRTIQ